MTPEKDNKPQHKKLRTLGHQLKPVVIIAGKGLSEGVLTELQRALDDHELIKVKVVAGDREIKKTIIQDLCEATGAELIQTIGSIALILRRVKKPNPQLSNLLRLKS